MSLSSFSVARPIAISMLCLGIMLCGVVALPRMPLELLPSSAPRQITIITNLRGGIAPREVEERVTRRLEEALGRLSYLDEMESSSLEGRSMIYLRFLPEANTDLSVLEIEESLSKVRSKLPREAEAPVVSKEAIGDKPILTYAFYAAPDQGEDLSLEIMRGHLSDSLKPQLEKVRGVARVDVIGGREKKILVDVNTAKLRQRGLSWGQLLKTLHAANVQETSGEMTQQSSAVPVRVMGALRSSSELPGLPITAQEGGLPFRLSDIASVQEGYLKVDSYARLNQQEVVGVTIYKESGSNTLDVSDGIKRALKKSADSLRGKGLEWEITTDQSRYIRDALDSVRNALLLGALLAIIFLVLFLGDLSHALLVGIAIPFSVLGTLFLLYLWGGSLNVMTLAGFALGIGMLTDNTIVVLEHVKSQRGPRTPSSIVLATEQMRLPMSAATFTTMVAFFPLIFMHKEMQRLYAPLGAVVIGALLFSLFAAIALAPMLLNLLPSIPLKFRKPGLWMDTASRWYASLLSHALRKRFLLVGIAIGILALSLIGLGRLPKDVMGMMQDRFVLARIKPPAGANLANCNAIMNDLESFAEGLPAVKKTIAFVKRDDLRLTLELKKTLLGQRAKYHVMDQLRARIQNHRDAFLYFEGGQQEETLKALDIEVFFDDPAAIPSLSKAVGKTLASVNALKDLRVRTDPLQPEYHLEIDRRKAAALGLTAQDIANQVHLQMRGMVPTRLFQGESELETVTRLAPDEHQDLTSIKGLLLDAPGTGGVPLSTVVNFRMGEGASTIWRKDRKRVIQWIGNIQKESLEGVATQVRQVMKKVELPLGSYWDFGRSYQQFVRTNQEMRQAILLVLALLTILLTGIFQSFLKPLIIFSAIAMSAVGVFLTLLLTGSPITPSVGIGFLILAGIVTNNAILLVDRLGKAEKTGGLMLPFVIAAQSRFRPIIMTTLTTVLGFLPMALSGGESAALWKPLSITLIGGLVASTLFTLFLTPLLYWICTQELKGRIVGLLASFR